MRRICLVTTGQPSTNPRLVKEADALVAAGYEVHVVGAHWAAWADATDRTLLGTRQWSCNLVDWRRSTRPVRFWTTRARHAMARRLAPSLGGRRIELAAIHRVGPELATQARRVDAELYIAHNLGALPAAMAAAGTKAPVGFDAEDFHSGQLGDRDRAQRALTERIERTWLPRCAYVTAASPGIADAYARLCGIDVPRVVLNVFPLADRPAAPKATPGDPVQLYWFSQTIGPDRGLEDAVRAMSLLRPGATELHLRGTWQAGYEVTLRKLADDVGVGAHAIVHHQPAEPSEMVRLAARHDLGLALEPPVSENNDILWSNKVFTYLLAGLPVVLSRTTGQARLAHELGPASATYPPGDAQAMATALAPWLTGEATLGDARARAWTLGATRFNWDIEQERFLDTVAQVVPVRS
jgi:glycosyltransferase involved in cell wall biosynthesis